jgi:hypothetical protein
MPELTIRRGQPFELALTMIRRGLTDAARRAAAASVSFLTADGTPAGGPFPAVYDPDADGWVALCPARPEAAGTVLTTVESVTVAGIVYQGSNSLRVLA